MTESDHTSPASQRAQLLRVIADRIDQGWTPPSNLGLDSAQLNFHRKGEKAHEPWIEVFKATPTGSLEQLSNQHGVYAHQGFRGQLNGLRVEIDVYLDVVEQCELFIDADDETNEPERCPNAGTHRVTVGHFGQTSGRLWICDGHEDADGGDAR